jgi:DNA-binding NarL/FixJ family response regulator
LKNEKNKVVGVMGMSVAIDPTPTLTGDLHLLSPQKLKCFQLLIKGFSLKQIAFKMNLTYKTIEHYVADIRKKLNCKNTRELIVRYAKTSSLR